jgi:hypothetical protein
MARGKSQTTPETTRGPSGTSQANYGAIMSARRNVKVRRKNKQPKIKNAPKVYHMNAATGSLGNGVLFKDDRYLSWIFGCIDRYEEVGDFDVNDIPQHVIDYFVLDSEDSTDYQCVASLLILELSYRKFHRCDAVYINEEALEDFFEFFNTLIVVESLRREGFLKEYSTDTFSVVIQNAWQYMNSNRKYTRGSLHDVGVHFVVDDERMKEYQSSFGLE